MDGKGGERKRGGGGEGGGGTKDSGYVFDEGVGENFEKHKPAKAWQVEK